MVDIVALKSEISTDPKAIGYAAQITVENDNGVANLINALTGAGAVTITLQTMTHDAFAMMIAPAVMALGTATAALNTKWTPLLNLVSGITTVHLTPTVFGMVNGLVTDALLTAAAVTAGTTRTGSRAEVLWGEGTVIGWRDVAAAYGRAA
jgi:hypothetical protein